MERTERMNSEARLLRRALKGEVKDLIECGFDAEMVMEPYGSALKVLVDFYLQTGEVLSKAQLLKTCDRLEASNIPDKAQKRAVYYWQLLKNEMVEDTLQNTMEDVVKVYNNRKTDSRVVLGDITRRILELNSKIGSIDATIPSNAVVARELRKNYSDAKAGRMPGIPFPPEFTLLAETIGRLKPAQITTLAARTEVGKTWLGLLICLHAAVNGHRVVIASMEMAIIDIVRRLSALFGRVNFDRAIKGTLQGKNEKLFLNIVQGYEKSKGFWANIRFVDPSEITSVEAVEIKAANFDAELVMGDAFYDWPHHLVNAKDHEGVKDNLRIVRRVSLVSRRHWLLTAQLNRTADKVYSSDEFAMGGSDAFNHQSNYVIFLVQRKRDKKEKRVIMKLGKKRDAGYSPPRVHNWDFKRMDISQIGIYNEDRSILAGGDI